MCDGNTIPSGWSNTTNVINPGCVVAGSVHTSNFPSHISNDNNNSSACQLTSELTSVPAYPNSNPSIHPESTHPTHVNMVNLSCFLESGIELLLLLLFYV